MHAPTRDFDYALQLIEEVDKDGSLAGGRMLIDKIKAKLPSKK